MLVEMAEGEAVEVAVAVVAKKYFNTNTGFYDILKKCAHDRCFRSMFRSTYL